MEEKKAFLSNPKHHYCVSQYGEHDCSAHNKKNGHYYGIEVCPISWVNINYKENGRKKAFLANQKHQYRVSPHGEHDCSAHNKKNGDYYRYPSLSHFRDEL